MVHTTPFSRELRRARNNTRDPDTGKALSQEYFAELIASQLGGNYPVPQTISNWERGLATPDRERQKILYIIVAILFAFDGLKTKDSIDHLLECIQHRSLNSEEFIDVKIFSKNFINSQREILLFDLPSFSKMTQHIEINTSINSEAYLLPLSEWMSIYMDTRSLFINIKNFETLVTSFTYYPSEEHLKYINNSWKLLQDGDTRKIKEHCRNIGTINDKRIIDLENFINGRDFITYAIIDLESENRRTHKKLEDSVNNFWNKLLNLLDVIFDHIYNKAIINN